MNDEQGRAADPSELHAEAESPASAAKHGGPDRSSPYPVSRLSGPVSLVDVAREIERADQWIASTSSAKLEQIAAQMKLLREQAEQVLCDAQQNSELHRAEARFQRHPGKIYHLYERASGQRYWSMLSPSDWGERVPSGYLGSYRLEADQSWTPLERIVERDRERAPYQEWLRRGLASDAPAPLTPHLEASLARGRARVDPPAAAAVAQPFTSSSDKETACESSSSPPSDQTDRA
ncbi:MAG: hypothetical protein JWN48_614 [Myxococcaceae bacterium]|nr:hypothetical protein [Myxococcaceae bacterium]